MFIFYYLLYLIRKIVLVKKKQVKIGEIVSEIPLPVSMSPDLLVKFLCKKFSMIFFLEVTLKRNIFFVLVVKSTRADRTICCWRHHPVKDYDRETKICTSRTIMFLENGVSFLQKWKNCVNNFWNMVLTILFLNQHFNHVKSASLLTEWLTSC